MSDNFSDLVSTGTGTGPGPGTGTGTGTVRRRRIGWLGIAIAIFFGLFFVYDLFEAISNVVGVTAQINSYNQARAVVKLSAVPIPWGWLIIDLALAPVVYVIALLIARRQSTPLQILVFFASLAVVAATTLTIEKVG